MENCTEKNLLNEITYWTRLIGQHKQGQATMNKKWDRNIACGTANMNYQNEKALKCLKLTKSVRPNEFTYNKGVHPADKQSSVNLSYTKFAANHQERLHNREEQKLNVYINPKFKNGSIDKQHVNVDPKFSTCLSGSQGSSVHINPNFCSKLNTDILKVHINADFNSVPNGCLKSGIHVNPVTESDLTTEQKLKVHVNPKFCKLLSTSSPNTQLRTLVSNKVHVNPKLVERVLKENEHGTSGTKKLGNAANKLVQVPSVGTFHNNSVIENNYVHNLGDVKFCVQKGDMNELISTQCNSIKSEFMTLGRRKLVRIHHRPLKLENELRYKERLKIPRNSIALSKQKALTTISPSRSVKKAKLLTSKYKLIKLQSSNQMATGKLCVGSKYKIDRRSTAVNNTLQNFMGSREGYKDVSSMRLKKSCSMKTSHKLRRFSINSMRTSNGNMVWRRTWSLQAKEFKTTNTKLYRIGSSPILKKKNDLSTAKNSNICNKALVRIGGVLYKSSRNKLTRSHGSLSVGGKKQSESIVALKKKKKTVAKGQVLFIRGQKFVMDAQGKTLRRLPSSVGSNQTASRSYSFRRVDIGGVTFVKKSSGLLMRTNTHKARSLLSYAKQKSIATLMKKLKKNNQPCIFFQKFGRCLRMEKGTCPCVHDRKHVAVCKRFLQAKCSLDGCLLSHDVVPEKMPTCRYFLEGCCNRVNCPYLHVKVNAKADICNNFLQGYCSNGKRCKKRHVCICPDFEKKGVCMKGKHCPYPHEDGRPKRRFSRKRTPIQASKQTLSDEKRPLELKKTNTLLKSKGELKRYYLAPEETIGQSSKEITSHEKQCIDKLNIPCKSEVSNTCGRVSVVNSRDIKIVISERSHQREKLGILPSFIPL